MADGFTITINTAELDAALKALPSRVEAEAAVRPALQAAGDVMLAPMKTLCPVRTDEAESSDSTALASGVLQYSLTTEVLLGKRYAPRVKVGPPSETSHVAWWIENGFDNVKSKKHVSGKHFMAAAFDESAEAAVGVFVETLSANLALGKGGE